MFFHIVTEAVLHHSPHRQDFRWGYLLWSTLSQPRYTVTSIRTVTRERRNTTMIDTPVCEPSSILEHASSFCVGITMQNDDKWRLLRQRHAFVGDLSPKTVFFVIITTTNDDDVVHNWRPPKKCFLWRMVNSFISPMTLNTNRPKPAAREQKWPGSPSERNQKVLTRKE